MPSISDTDYPPRNSFEKFARMVYRAVDGPVTWFRETVVVPSRGEKYNYYHRKFPRVPEIDECYEGDVACVFEADIQFRRDKKVEAEIVTILRNRLEDCVMYERPDHKEKCKKVREDFDEASTNYFIKYGELGAYGNVVDAFMKQKHRLIWERRHADKSADNGFSE